MGELGQDPGVRSWEPSSMTTTCARRARSRAAAATLSRIVISSFERGHHEDPEERRRRRRGRPGARALAAAAHEQHGGPDERHDDQHDRERRTAGQRAGRPVKGVSSVSELAGAAARPASGRRARPRARPAAREGRTAGRPTAARSSRGRTAPARRRRRCLERADDPLRRLAVAVGVGRLGHRGVGVGSSSSACPRRRSARGRCRPAAACRLDALGRSVVSRATSTGLPSDGASSWMPPESVITRCERFSRRANSA